jgi:hypothetical protein
MMKLLLISGCVLVLCGSSALAQSKQTPINGPSPEATTRQSEQMAMAPDAKPSRHRIAYTDQYGFHFDKGGLLVDDDGYPITAHPR